MEMQWTSYGRYESGSGDPTDGTGENPFLGICLGLQLLFECSEETPGVQGLGILKGKILKIPDQAGTEDPAYGMEFPSSSA